MAMSVKPMETAEVKVMPSGLEVIVIRKPGFVRKYAVMAVRFGSEVTGMRFAEDREEYELPQGTAHFLEHKLFEKEEGNIEELFSELGASSNAFTSNDITGYLYVTNENFFECLSLLFRLVREPSFSDIGVEKEKDIIRQEIMMTRDDPDWMGYRTLLNGLYSAHPLAIDPAGTEASIGEITSEVLFAAHDAFYAPSNTTLLIVGDVAADDVFDVASVLDAKHPVSQTEQVEVASVVEPDIVNRTECSIKMDVARPIMWIGFKDAPAEFEAQAARRRMAASLLADAIFGPSSRLNDLLYTEGVIDDNLAYDEHYSHDYGYMSVVAATSSPGRLVDELRKATQAAASAGVEPEAFELAKRRLIGSQVRSFDSEEFIAYEYLVDRFRGMNLMDRPSLLESVTKDEVDRLAKSIFRRERTTVLSVEPFAAGGGTSD